MALKNNIDSPNTIDKLNIGNNIIDTNDSNAIENNANNHCLNTVFYHRILRDEKVAT